MKKRKRVFYRAGGSVLLALMLLMATSVSSEAQQDARSLYLEGRECLIEEKFDEALSIFREVVKNHEESESADDAQFYIGYTLERMGQIEEAVRAFKELVEKWPDSIRVESAQAHLVDLAGEREDLTDDPLKLQVLITEKAPWNLRRDAALAMARKGDLSAVTILEEIMERESSSRQQELIRILGDHLSNPIALRIIGIALEPSRSTSVQLLALRTLKEVADDPEATALIGIAISDRSSSSVQQKVVEVLSPHTEKLYVRQVIVRSLGRQYPSSVQLMAVRALKAHLLKDDIRPYVTRLFEYSYPSSVQIAALNGVEIARNQPESASVLAVAVHNRNPSTVQLKAMQIAYASENLEVRHTARFGLDSNTPSSVQYKAVQTLGKGSNDPVAAKALEDMFNERNMPSSVQLEGLDALASHMDTPAAHRALAAALHSSKPSSVQSRALNLVEELITIDVVKEALLRVVRPGRSPSSVQLKAVKIMGKRAEEPAVHGIIGEALNHSNPSSVQLAAVEVLKPEAAQSDVRRMLAGVLTRRFPTSVVLASMRILNDYVEQDSIVKDAFTRALRDKNISSTARVRAAEALLYSADESLKREILIAMEDVLVKLHRTRKRSMNIIPWSDLFSDALEVVQEIDPELAEEFRKRYGKPPSLIGRILGLFSRE